MSKSKAAAASTFSRLRTPRLVRLPRLHRSRSGNTALCKPSSLASVQLFKLLGHGLIGLFQHLDELSCQAELVRGEEGVGRSHCSSTSSAANAMDVVRNLFGEVVVDDILDVFYIKST